MNETRHNKANDNTAALPRVPATAGAVRDSSVRRDSSEERSRPRSMPGVLAGSEKPGARGRGRSSQQSVVASGPVKRHHAQVSDFIQYRYDVNGFVRNDTRLGAGLITEVIDNGAAFIVDGEYEVKAKRITAHIPSEANQKLAISDADDDDDYYWCAIGRKHR